MMKNFEAKVRRKLSKYPLLYAFLGGVGLVLFWRGVWLSTDFIAMAFGASRGGTINIDWAPGVDSVLSLIVGMLLLLSTGLFVNELLGKEIIETDIKKEEELTVKTKQEVGKEETELSRVEREIHHLIRKVEEMDGELHEHEKTSKK